MSGTSEGAKKSADKQAAATAARRAEGQEKVQNPENVIGTDAYARKHGLPPYDK